VINKDISQKVYSPDDVRNIEKLAKDMKIKKLEQELEKYKNAIGYFEQIGYKDIVKNLLSY
jgi:hypothetical protein